MKDLKKLAFIGGLALLCFCLSMFLPRETPAGIVLFKGNGYAVYWMKKLLVTQARSLLNPLEHASLIYHEGVLYGGTSEGKFYAISADSGQVLWEFQSDGSIESEPLWDEETVFFGNSEGTFYALKADTGEVLWFFPTGKIVFSRPVIDGNNIIILNNDNRLFSLDKFRGDVIWIKTIETESNFNQNIFYGSSSPVIYGGKIYVGLSDGFLACLSLQGELIWKKDLAEGIDYRDLDATPVISGNVLVIPNLGAVSTFGINPDTGDILWKIPEGGNTGGVVSKNDSVCLPLVSKNPERGDLLKLSCLNPANGIKTWESDNIKSIEPEQDYGWNPTLPLFLGNKSVFGLSGNGLAIIDNENGKVAGFMPLSSGISSKPVQGEGRDIFVISNDGYIYKILIL
ncbi:MAG: PQQ-binding-like beta-propeller repeat protein [bacterium]|nr:PQQ-binding-like beta-propeller repeat protein [bacterium]